MTCLPRFSCTAFPSLALPEPPGTLPHDFGWQ